MSGIDERSRALTQRRATFGDVVPALSTASLQAASDAALLAVPGFRQLHAERWNPPLPVLEALAALPEDSFGHCYARFMAHYQLTPGFFPIEVRLGAEVTPTRYAVHRLNTCHDFLHVLGAYETSDADEVSIQSFVFGVAPVVLATFLEEAARHPDIHREGYKHLRDIYSGTIQVEDFERGRAATSLLGERFESFMEWPLEAVRRRLGICARAPEHLGRGGINSCGGYTAIPFFSPARAA